MNDHSANLRSSTQDLLSKVSRYEALFELTGVINAASDIESVGEVLARRLKYIVDVYSVHRAQRGEIVEQHAVKRAVSHQNPELFTNERPHAAL